MAYSGKFNPRNKSKYKGDFTKITYRSSLERNLMNWLDNRNSVIAWSSEEVIVPYRSPLDGKMHRYFVDNYVEYVTKEGEVIKMLIEVKPDSQTRPPKKKANTATVKIKNRYIRECATWAVNEAKWKAAGEYCKRRDWEFKILTEKQLKL